MISTLSIKRQYSPLTPTQDYSFDIRYFIPEDINLVVVDSQGASTDLVLNAPVDGFTVFPVNGDPALGCNVVTTEEYTDGDSVTVYREVPLTQLDSFQRGGDLPPEVLNSALDRGVAISQELDEAYQRTLSCPISDPDGLSYILPTVALREGKFISCDAQGNIVAIGTIISGINEDHGLEINSGILSVTVDNVTIGFEGGALEVKDLSLTEIKLASSSVTSTKIRADAVTTPKIENNAVVFDKMQTIPGKRVIGNMSSSTANPNSIAVLDEDDMVSNSDLSLATQQSIKAYVDAQVVASGTWVDEYQHLGGDTIDGDYAWAQVLGSGLGDGVHTGRGNPDYDVSTFNEHNANIIPANIHTVLVEVEFGVNRSVARIRSDMLDENCELQHNSSGASTSIIESSRIVRMTIQPTGNIHAGFLTLDPQAEGLHVDSLVNFSKYRVKGVIQRKYIV